jgi:hypothetical protein
VPVPGDRGKPPKPPNSGVVGVDSVTGMRGWPEGERRQRWGRVWSLCGEVHADSVEMNMDRLRVDE